MRHAESYLELLKRPANPETPVMLDTNIIFQFFDGNHRVQEAAERLLQAGWRLVYGPLVRLELLNLLKQRLFLDYFRALLDSKRWKPGHPIQNLIENACYGQLKDSQIKVIREEHQPQDWLKICAAVGEKLDFYTKRLTSVGFEFLGFNSKRAYPDLHDPKRIASAWDRADKRVNEMIANYGLASFDASIIATLELCPNAIGLLSADSDMHFAYAHCASFADRITFYKTRD